MYLRIFQAINLVSSYRETETLTRWYLFTVLWQLSPTWLVTFPTSSCPCLERHQNYLWDFLKGLDGRWGRSRSGKVDVWIRTRIWAYLSTVVVFFFCKSGLFQRQTYVQPIRSSFERGWRRRDSFVSLRYIYNLLTPNRSFLARFGSMPGEFSGANRVLARHAYRETKRAWSAAKVYEKGAIRYLTYLNLAKLA